MNGILTAVWLGVCDLWSTFVADLNTKCSKSGLKIQGPYSI